MSLQFKWADWKMCLIMAWFSFSLTLIKSQVLYDSSSSSVMHGCVSINCRKIFNKSNFSHAIIAMQIQVGDRWIIQHDIRALTKIQGRMTTNMRRKAFPVSKNLFRGQQRRITTFIFSYIPMGCLLHQKLLVQFYTFVFLFRNHFVINPQ